MRINSFKSLKMILLESLEKYSSIGIVTHYSPDGDGFCSALALQDILSQKNIKAEIILEKTAPPVYDFLKGREKSIVFSDDLTYKLLLILDCHEEERIGKCAPLISKAEKIIAIDHHPENVLISNAETYIDTDKVSVGVIVYNLFADEISSFPKHSQKYIAEAVYTTILNDSDNFINANTDEETFRISAELMKLGLIPGNIAEKFLMNKTPAEMRFIGEVLSMIKTYSNNKILFMHSTVNMLQKNNLTRTATDKMTRWVKGTRDVKVLIYFQETEPGKFRLHLRSNFIDVNKIAVKYDGGGHIRASGCEIAGFYPELEKKLLEDIKEQL